MAMPRRINFAFMSDRKADNFRRALDQKGIKRVEVAKLANVSPQTVNHWLQRGVAASKASLIAKMLNVRPDDISQVEFESGKAKLDLLVRETQSKYGESSGSEEMHMIPQLDVSVSLGNGNSGGNNSKVIDHWPVEKRMLYKIGVEPVNAVLVLCEGDSMEPTISDGDLVVIDKGASKGPYGGVYAIQSSGGIRIKRINLRLDQKLEIISDNLNKDKYPTECYEAETADEIIHVLGKVVRKYWGRIA